MYTLPIGVQRAEVTLYYQSISGEYVTFLRDENTSNDLGEQLYQAWQAQGRAAPVVMATATAQLEVTDAGTTPEVTALLPPAPNPFNPTTTLTFRLASSEDIALVVFDVRGRRIRTVAAGPWAAGTHSVRWDGRDEVGRPVAAGSYLVALRTEMGREVARLTLVR